MSKVKLEENDMLSFICPGCDKPHAIRTTGPYAWSWNNDFNNPTINPSVLTKSTQLSEEGERQYKEWCKNNYPKTVKEFDKKQTICHLFIREGMIEYLSDCTHSLAGQTVELPDWR